METDSNKVRIRCPVRNTTWLHREQPGHRGQPDQDQRHYVHEATQVQKGLDETHRVYGYLEQVH